MLEHSLARLKVFTQWKKHKPGDTVILNILILVLLYLIYMELILAFSCSLLSRSSAIVSLIPLPLGRDTWGLFVLPMMNTLLIRVANEWPVLSFTWTMSNEPAKHMVRVEYFASTDNYWHANKQYFHQQGWSLRDLNTCRKETQKEFCTYF